MKTSQKLQKLVNDLAKVRRNHYIPSTDEHESNIHHSYSVAMLAWMIHDELNLDLDMAKVLKYALIHDMVEVYAGDTNAYADEELKKEKKIRERQAYQRLAKEFRSIFPDFISAIESYEAHSDKEGEFVWTIDKIQALVQGNIDDMRPFYELGLTREDVKRTHGKKMGTKVPDACKVRYFEIRDEFLDRYDDMKISSSPRARSCSIPPRK